MIACSLVVAERTCPEFNEGSRTGIDYIDNGNHISIHSDSSVDSSELLDATKFYLSVRDLFYVLNIEIFWKEHTNNYFSILSSRLHRDSLLEATKKGLFE